MDGAKTIVYFLASLMRAWTNEEVVRYLGDHHACYLTHASDDVVRVGAASGGSTSQILISLLEEGIVDGVLVWRMVYGGESPGTEAVIALVAGWRRAGGSP